MIVSCASCQSKFKIDPARVPAAGTRIRCPKCKGVITVGPVPAKAGPTARSAAVSSEDHRDDLAHHGEHAGAPNPTHAPDGAPAPFVLVAHGNPTFCDTLAGFLKRNHFACETATDGEAALALVAQRRPAVLLVDVALPGIVGYKLSEQIKADRTLAGTHVVLIGAVYDRSRYRRPPASLYGSDGYIEKHEIPDKLVPMLTQLMSGESPSVQPAAPKPSPARESAGAPHSSAAAPSPSPARAAAAESPSSEQARRLARIIVSDIVLYNPDVVKRGIADGNLPDLLTGELKEGRDLLRARMGAEASAADYVLEALEDYVRRMNARTSAAAQR